MLSFKMKLAAAVLSVIAAAAVVTGSNAQEVFQSDPVAQLKLGNSYHNGTGVERDEVEAVRWWRRAAEQGNATAQNNLGRAYYVGVGVKEDQEEAVKWFRKAADQGDVVAQRNLGIAYHDGAGVKKNDEQAFYWWGRAAEQGDNASLILLRRYEKK